MYYYKEELINVITPDQPDPEAAKVLQEILGGHFGEMRTMMQYFFQSSNFRGKDTQYRDLLRGVFLEEIAHVELVQNTINQLLNDSGESSRPGNAGADQRLLTMPSDMQIRIIILLALKLPFRLMPPEILGTVLGFTATAT